MQKRVRSENIKITEEDIHRSEETEKPRYPKSLDIGRMVIGENPEEKQPVVERRKIKDTPVDMETCDTIGRGPAPQVKKDMIKVGKINITDYEKKPRESHSPQILQTVN